MGLGICSGCRRFARGEVCPFCGASVAAPVARAGGRRTRTGKLVASATVAVAGAAVALACSSEGSNAPLYGAPAYGDPPFDSGKADTSMTDGGSSDGSVVDTGSDARDAASDAPSDVRDGG